MKAENNQRFRRDESGAYTDDHFYAKAEQLRNIAANHDDQL